MSGRSWTGALAQALANKGKPPVRVALVGVGNELNGDDAAGGEVIRRLSRYLPSSENLLLLNAGSAPENFSGPLRRFKPDWLIFIDAAWMEEPPGAIRWVEMDEVEGVSAATHGLPVTMLAGYLMTETECRVGLIAIQPASLEFEAKLTPVVVQAVDEVVDGLCRVFSDCDS